MNILWGTSQLYYSGRTHVVLPGTLIALCTREHRHPLPMDDLWAARPAGYRLCPECALAILTQLFPVVPVEKRWRPAPRPRKPDHLAEATP